MLLIVPYGIETHSSNDSQISFNCLLIVPYGIETKFHLVWEKFDCLLIVPYGIETRTPADTSGHQRTFNRTLWN